MFTKCLSIILGFRAEIQIDLSVNPDSLLSHVSSVVLDKLFNS